MSRGFKGKARYTYTADDARGYGYKHGEQTRVTFEARRINGKLSIRVLDEEYGFGPLRIRIAVHCKGDKSAVLQCTDRKELTLKTRTLELTGGKLHAMRSVPITLGTSHA